MNFEEKLRLAANLANLAFILAGVSLLLSFFIGFKNRKKKSIWKTIFVGLGIGVGIILVSGFVNYFLVYSLYYVK